MWTVAWRGWLHISYGTATLVWAGPTHSLESPEMRSSPRNVLTAAGEVTAIMSLVRWCNLRSATRPQSFPQRRLGHRSQRRRQVPRQGRRRGGCRNIIPESHLPPRQVPRNKQKADLSIIHGMMDSGWAGLAVRARSHMSPISAESTRPLYAPRRKIKSCWASLERFVKRWHSWADVRAPLVQICGSCSWQVQLSIFDGLCPIVQRSIYSTKRNSANEL